MAFLRAVDVAEADTLRVGVVENFNGVAIEDGDDGAGEGRECSYWMEQEEQKADRKMSHQSLLHYSTWLWRVASW